MPHSTRLLIILCGLGGLVGCGPDRQGDFRSSGPWDEATEIGLSTSSITADYTADSGHPEVGRLLIDATGGTAQDTCTAVLIDKQVVLTAAHCLAPTKNNLFQLFGKLYQVTKEIGHGSWNASSSKYKHDIGLAFLQDPVTSVTSFPAYGAATPTVGMSITLVGMGKTSAGASDSGIKRKAQNKIAVVSTGYFTVTGTGGGVGNICYGDSGGPVYTLSGGNEVVLGIISADQSPYCSGTKSFHVTVKDYVGWIQTNMKGGDTTAPQVTIDSPKHGAVVPTSVAFQVTATDNVAVTEVEAEVDGASAGKLTAAPYVFLLTLTPGSHALRAMAKDAAGNSGTAQISVSAVEGPAPEAGLPQPEAGPVTGDGPPGGGDASSPDRPHEGCALAPGPGDPASLLALLLGLLVLTRRRVACPIRVFGPHSRGGSPPRAR